MSEAETRDLIATTAHVRDLFAQDRSMHVVASNEALDAHGTIIDQGGWDLKRYALNPVVLYAHNQRDLPIGYASDVAVRDGALEARLHFVTKEANPLAEQIWQLVQQKALRAVSVGLFANDVAMRSVDGEDIPTITQSELLEISVVPIPSNPQAVAKMRERALNSGPRAEGARVTDPIVEVVEDAVPVEVDEAEARALELQTKHDVLLERLAVSQAEVAAVSSERDVLKAERDALRARVVELVAGSEARERAALIAAAEADGKVTPAMKPALDALSIEQLASLLKVAPKVVPFGSVDAGPKSAAGAGRNFEDMGNMERAALYASDPDTYRALKAEAEARASKVSGR